ncbi:MAG TPA: TonB-dependent receptor, partial [Tenuifilaceae bacterium]|nr:TonB-dependent receptor [Tenuifilaceae bacterium]HQN82933.1 TonB-dependent receptor [Tenuifilaceae bacterium]HQQ28661.1 TonB-dependent receptor [Tenuifilaceae bacterium]
VSGRVTDAETGETLPGVNVIVKGTTRGTTTDVNGNYKIELIAEDKILSFSFVGYEDVELEVLNQKVVDVALKVKSTLMQEVVVVGYGTQKAKDLTAPIVTVKGNDLSKQVTSNPLNALQGKVSGVQIINSGVPGSGASIKIRGVGSVGDYANPLYVVDGVFVDNIDFISPSDVEELTILKDASAAAIYGVRAANGVIIITTRKGKSGLPVVSYDGYVGVQMPVNILKMASKNQYITLLNEANANIPGYIPKNPSDYPTSTDWYNELVRTAGINNHNIDITGATDKTSYSIGGNFLYQNGIMDAQNNYQRYNIRGRLEQQVNKNLKIGINTIISNYNKNIPNSDAFFGAYVNPPVYTVYDPTNAEAYPVKFGAPQKYGFGNQYGNPVAAAYYADNFEKGHKEVFSIFGEVDIVKDILSYRVAYNQDQDSWNQRYYTPQFYVGGSQGVTKSNLTKTFGNSSKQIIDNLLTLKRTKGKTSYTVLFGQSTRIEKRETLSGYANSVPGYDDQSKYLVNGSFRDRNAYDAAERYNGLSFFTRGTLNFREKYLATVTFRADASSKYQKKWGYFPSVGFAWNISQEGFSKLNAAFSNLKLRLSWGMLGNDNVPSNSSVILGQTGIGSSGVFGDNLVDGMGAQTVLQNYLRWETVTEFDVGIDYTLKNEKLSGEVDYYHRVTNNVVFYAPIATGGGVAELLGNNGKVLNTGLEFTLNWKDEISEDFNYFISFNATFNHNEVLELNGREYIPSGYIRGNYTTRTAVGHPIGSFYGYEIDGVYKSEGDALKDPVSQAIKDKGYFKYKDQNGDKVIDDKDKVYLGSAIPWLISGLDMGINFKKFDISLSIAGQYGNKILNAKRMNRDVFSDGNYDEDFYQNRWTSSNKSSEYPSAEAYNSSFIQQANDFFVENGFYIRIQNIQLGYTTDKISFIPKFRVFITAQRPFTFFTYKGFTPEVGGSPISSGIDNNVYPMQAIYTLGLKMMF